MTKYKYGWHKQLGDFRDNKMSFSRYWDSSKLPTVVSLIGQFPPIDDQGQIGSCTGNAIGSAIEHRLIVEKYKYLFKPSRLFIYYNERVIEGTTDSDSGANIRDGIKSVNTQGVCPENQLGDAWSWPYDTTKLTVKPPESCYKDAVLHKAIKYEAVDQTEIALCSALSNGYPIICGITCYDSFEADEVIQTGIVPLPKPWESVVGGHAILLVGYDKANRLYDWRNSWGISYGNKGYGKIPFAYIHDPDLSSDFWIIDLVK